jgi:hypothetical protein
LEEAVAQMDVGDTPLPALSFGKSFSHFVLAFFSCIEQKDKGFIHCPAESPFANCQKRVSWCRQWPKTAKTV